MGYGYTTPWVLHNPTLGTCLNELTLGYILIMDNLKLEELLSELEILNDAIIHSGKKLLETHGIYSFDLFCVATLNRSVNIIRGYVALVRDNNFICAGTLVRIHLDSLLRIFASTIVNMNIDVFSMKVMNGKSIRSFVDKNNNKLNDRFLVAELSKIKKFEWVSNLYDTGNRYVHLSEKHIFTSSKLGVEPRSIRGGILLNDEFVKIEEKIGGTKWMIHITFGILEYINIWIKTKREL